MPPTFLLMGDVYSYLAASLRTCVCVCLRGMPNEEERKKLCPTCPAMLLLAPHNSQHLHHV